MLKRCCTSTLKVGCFSPCDCIETGLTATVSGEHTIEYQSPDGALITGTVEITSGNEVKFKSFFNEVGVAIFKIKDPDGNYMTSGSNDCFSADIAPQSSVTVETC